jgi:hypothetical protein
MCGLQASGVVVGKVVDHLCVDLSRGPGIFGSPGTTILPTSAAQGGGYDGEDIE